MPPCHAKPGGILQLQPPISYRNSHLQRSSAFRPVGGAGLHLGHFRVVGGDLLLRSLRRHRGLGQGIAHGCPSVRRRCHFLRRRLWPARGARTPGPGPPEHGHPQHRDHRACRPWQDHAGRRAAEAVRHLPREPGDGRAGARFERPRARARHHHPRQGDLGRVAGPPHQHRRHARPRRLRRRGRAHPRHGRRRAAARRRRRGADAADQVRHRQGAARSGCGRSWC